MILIYETKPEHIQQILFSGFGKYEHINKLPPMLEKEEVQIQYKIQYKIY